MAFGIVADSERMRHDEAPNHSLLKKDSEISFLRRKSIAFISHHQRQIQALKPKQIIHFWINGILYISYRRQIIVIFLHLYVGVV